MKWVVGWKKGKQRQLGSVEKLIMKQKWNLKKKRI